MLFQNKLLSIQQNQIVLPMDYTNNEFEYLEIISTNELELDYIEIIPINFDKIERFAERLSDIKNIENPKGKIKTRLISSLSTGHLRRIPGSPTSLPASTTTRSEPILVTVPNSLSSPDSPSNRDPVKRRCPKQRRPKQRRPKQRRFLPYLLASISVPSPRVKRTV